MAAKNESGRNNIGGMNSKDKESSGRKGRLDDHTIGYYRKVRETLTDGQFGSEDDDKMVFFNNVFSTLTSEVLEVAQNQTVSCIVESLLKEGSLSQLTNVSGEMARDWELACTDRFASHVTQTMLHELGQRVSSSQNSDPDAKEARQAITGLYGFLMSNLGYHMQDTYASHILRVMLEVLAGVSVSEKIVRSRVARQSRDPKKEASKLKAHKDFHKLLDEMCNRIMKLDKLQDHACNNLSSPVIQTVVLVLKAQDPHKCSSVCETLVKKLGIFSQAHDDGNTDTNTKSSLPVLFVDGVGSHLVEQIIGALDTQAFDKVLASLESQLLNMAVHPLANYVLQKLIRITHTPEQFETIFSKLYHHLEDLLGLNRSQVIISLADGCVRHHCSQAKLLKYLMKAFHCHKPAERMTKFVPLVASLMAYEAFFDSAEGGSTDSSDHKQSTEEKSVTRLTFVNLHGSLLLQQLFKLDEPKSVVSSFLELSPEELRTMSCDPCGSHVIDAFLSSATVTKKSPEAFHQKLKGLYIEVCCHKSGSRVVESLLRVLPVKQKSVIAAELTKQQPKLTADRFGRIIWYKFGLQHYMKNPKEWQESQEGQNRKRKLFMDLVDTSNADQKKKKKKDRDLKHEETPKDLDSSQQEVQEEKDSGSEHEEPLSDEQDRKREKKRKKKKRKEQLSEEEPVHCKKSKKKKRH